MNLMTNGQFDWHVRILHHLINKRIVRNNNACAYMMHLVN